MASLGTLAVNIVARTSKFTSGITKSLGLTNKFTRGVGAAGLAVTAFAATTVAAGSTVVRTYEGINSAMNKSLAIMGEVTDMQRTEMLQTALQVSRTTQKTTREAAESYYFLASAGMDAAQSLKAMPVVAKFAQAGNFDMALATDLATDAQSALGLTSKDTAKSIKGLTRVTNVLIKANTLANASAQQFSEAVTNGAGAAMRTANIPMEQGVAVLAAFADQGIKGAEAGTAYGIVLRDLQTKALKNKAAFAAAGVSVFDASGAMQNMADIVGNLEGLLGPLSVAQRKSTLMAMGFSDKSVKYIQALAGTSEKIRGYEAGLVGSNAASEVAAKSMTDLEKAGARMAATWDSLAIKIGTAAEKLGVFSSAAEFLEGVGVILDRVDTTIEGQGNKSSNYRENLTGSSLFSFDGARRMVYDSVLGDAKDTAPAKSQEEIAKWVENFNRSQSPEGIAEAQAKATSDSWAKVLNQYVRAPLEKLEAQGRSAGVSGAGVFSGAVAAASKAEAAVKKAMTDDALFSASFGLLGKRAGMKGAGMDGAAGGYVSTQDLTARRAGDLDTYAAQRRNLGDRSAQTQIDIARKQLEVQKKTREALASHKPAPVFTLGSV